MTRTVIVWLGGLVLMAASTLAQSAAAPPEATNEPACSVTYDRPDSELALQLDQQLRLLGELPAVLPDGKIERHASGAGTSAELIIHRPDTMRPGPWTTVLEMLSRTGHRTVLEVSDARDVGVAWLTEKLVFVQIWWGRITSEDIVFDMDAGKFVYREFARYGCPSATVDAGLRRNDVQPVTPSK